MGINVVGAGTVIFQNISGLVDYAGPAVEDFSSQGTETGTDGEARGWSSVVFSCPSTGERLFCAKFTASQGKACFSETRSAETAITSEATAIRWSDDDGFFQNGDIYLDWFDLFLLVVIFAFAFAMIYCSCRYGVFTFCCGWCWTDKEDRDVPYIDDANRRASTGERRPLLV
jgi:hypothetical protein